MNQRKITLKDKTRTLDVIFGKDSEGKTAEERAKSSKELWHRSQDHMSAYHLGQTGLVMSSLEALEVFGLELLLEACERGSAVLVCDGSEPARSIARRRHKMRLSVGDMAKEAGLSESEVMDAENSSTRTPMVVLGKLAKVLDFDVRTIGMFPLDPDDLKED